MGLCEASWFTVYDTFYGTTEHTYSQTFQVPFGPEPWNFDLETTKRRGGDWYISVHGLPDTAAEFSLSTVLLPPPSAPEYFKCSRFDYFCPVRNYHVGPGGEAELLESAGYRPQRGSGSPGLLSTPLPFVLSAGSALLLAWRPQIRATTTGSPRWLSTIRTPLHLADALGRLRWSWRASGRT